MEDCNKMELDLEMGRDTSNSTFLGREREATPFLSDAHAPGNAIFGEDDFSHNHHDDHHDEDDCNHQSSSGTNHNGPVEDMAMDYEVENNHHHHTGHMTPARGETPVRSESVRPASPTLSIAPSVVMEQDTVENFYERQAQKRQAQHQQNMKKRRMDEVKIISGDEMKANMNDYK